MIQGQLRRIYLGYRPDVFCVKRWKEEKIPYIRTIGVGYKDKGTLSSAPSWKDQMILDEGVSPAILSELSLMEKLLSFLDFLLSEEHVGLKSSSESEKGKR